MSYSRINMFILLAAHCVHCAACNAAVTDLWVATFTKELVLVDLPMGNSTVVGTFQPALFDIAFSPSRELYGVTSSSLYTLDTSTAQASFVGSLGVASTRNINALVFGHDGRLFAAGRTTNNLYEINPQTAQASLIGDMGVNSDGDLAFDRHGRLLLASSNNRIYEVNTSTAAASLIGGLDDSSVFGLANAQNGLLYGVADEDVLLVDIATGESEVVWPDAIAGRGTGAAIEGEASSVFLPADYDFDLLVNGNDIAVWRSTFGASGPFVFGDGDADADVDGADFLVWQRNLGSSAAPSSVLPVPEPTSLTLCAAWASMVFWNRSLRARSGKQ